MKLAILWHMHQPFYKNLVTNRYEMPWVRLHATKDYYDMVAMLEDFPTIKQTFNLVPSLCEQLEEYARGEAVDDHLELSARPADELTEDEKARIRSEFFRANFATMIAPYPRYAELYNLRDKVEFDAAAWRDLQVWSNLVWVDPMFRKQEPIARLFAKGRDFTEQDKIDLFAFQQRVISMIIPKYRAMAESGQIELSTSPYYHPILPLLCDTDIARVSRPQTSLPAHRFRRPEDAQLQIELALEYFASHFGFRPQGMWPSEGAVSEEAVELAAQAGVKWMATDEEILALSLGVPPRSSGDDTLIRKGMLYSPYRFATGGKTVHLFFRDHALSDLIGFVYGKVDAKQAARDFVDRLEAIDANARRQQLPEPVVSIILDGENAWEYYPNDGHDFLQALYSLLADHPSIKTVTFSEAMGATPEAPLLSRLHPGSWINHDLNIWIGHTEDNRAWELLFAAWQLLDEIGADAPNFDLAQKEVLIAEGSDWCWWFGGEHQTDDNDRFDQLYRSHLKNVYRLLGKPVPPELFKPIRSNFIMAHLTEPVDFLSPRIDGRITHYYEWSGAGFFDCQKAGTTMHRSQRCLRGILYGYGKNGEVYLRIDPALGVNLAELTLVIEFTVPPGLLLVVQAGSIAPSQKIEWLEFACDKLIEIGLRCAEIKGELAGVKIRVLQAGMEVEKWPPVDVIPLRPELAPRVYWAV